MRASTEATLGREHDGVDSRVDRRRGKLQPRAQHRHLQVRQREALDLATGELQERRCPRSSGPHNGRRLLLVLAIIHTQSGAILVHLHVEVPLLIAHDSEPDPGCRTALATNEAVLQQAMEIEAKQPDPFDGGRRCRAPRQIQVERRLAQAHHAVVMRMVVDAQRPAPVRRASRYVLRCGAELNVVTRHDQTRPQLSGALLLIPRPAALAACLAVALRFRCALAIARIWLLSKARSTRRAARVASLAERPKSLRVSSKETLIRGMITRGWLTKVFVRCG
jgi:hypothetical protein